MLGVAHALHRLELHKVSIQALSFSSDGEFLASLGGQDDNSIAVWETGSGRAVCGMLAGSHAALCVAWYHGRNDKLVTGGQYSVRSWDFNYERRRLTPDDLADRFDALRRADQLDDAAARTLADLYV